MKSIFYFFINNFFFVFIYIYHFVIIQRVVSDDETNDEDSDVPSRPVQKKKNHVRLNVVFFIVFSKTVPNSILLITI